MGTFYSTLAAAAAARLVQSIQGGPIVVWLDNIFQLDASYNPMTRGQHFQATVVTFFITLLPAAMPATPDGGAAVAPDPPTVGHPHHGHHAAGSAGPRRSELPETDALGVACDGCRGRTAGRSRASKGKGKEGSTRR